MIIGIARIFQQGAKTRERSNRAGEVCVCVCGGGGDVYPNGLFGTLKDLLLDPPPSMLFSLSNQWGGGAGLLYPLSYASDSGVTRICQREAKWRSKVTGRGGGGAVPLPR